MLFVLANWTSIKWTDMNVIRSSASSYKMHKLRTLKHVLSALYNDQDLLNKKNL